MHHLVTRQNLGLVLGPLLFVLMLLLPLPADMSPSALKVAAVACLMALWWVSEAAPIAATALLPIILFPLFGVMSTAETTSAYANHLIYLFLGGFLIAITMQKWNLHRRIAMLTLRAVGVSPNRMILGFMLATALLSMWISNTATTMMMLPIGMAVITQVDLIQKNNNSSAPADAAARSNFGVCLMLGIAYSASIGGVATLIGTPPNAILAGMVENIYGQTISFAAWLAFGLPLSVIMLALTWFYLTRIAYPQRINVLPGVEILIAQELAELGPIKREERWVLGVFLAVSSAWIARGLVNLPSLSMVTDASIAMAGALLLFVIPSNLAKKEFLLDWKTATGIPWDIIILFGGGFALAQGFSDSGLSLWIADQLSMLEGYSFFTMVAVVTLAVIFLTEVTSNTATATLMIPVLGALAIAMKVHPYSLMVPAAVAASFAFMLPVATPPNAIVFSSRCITIPEMAKAGFWLNMIAVGLISLFVLFLLPLVWGIDLSVIPESLILGN
jgi:sodium-dependent dicarboxylate transporter 2/3/5